MTPPLFPNVNYLHPGPKRSTPAARGGFIPLRREAHARCRNRKKIIQHLAGAAE